MSFVLFCVKAVALEDFSTEPQPLHAEFIHASKTSSSSNSHQDKNKFFIPIILLPMFFYSSRSSTQITSNKEAFEASKKVVSDTYIAVVVIYLWDPMHMPYKPQRSRNNIETYKT